MDDDPLDREELGAQDRVQQKLRPQQPKTEEFELSCYVKCAGGFEGDLDSAVRVIRWFVSSFIRCYALAPHYGFLREGLNFYCPHCKAWGDEDHEEFCPVPIVEGLTDTRYVPHLSNGAVRWEKNDGSGERLTYVEVNDV